MHPDRGEQNILVVVHAFADLGGQSIEPRLMAKFVGGLRLSANVFDNLLPPS
jgi:hypothetical protein